MLHFNQHWWQQSQTNIDLLLSVSAVGDQPETFPGGLAQWVEKEIFRQHGYRAASLLTL